MKRISALAAAFAVFASPAIAAERRYSVTDFDRVIVEGPFAVSLATGRSSGAVARGTQQALERVSLDVQGRTLRVRPNRSGWGGYPGESAGAVTIELATRDLRSATVAGSGTINIDRVAAMRLDLAVEGSGRISAANIETDHLSLGLMGSGAIDVSGTAKELRASLHGSGDLDASGLRAEGANIITDTAGSVSASVSREARVNAGGIGEVLVAGRASCTITGLSAAQVRCGSSNQGDYVFDRPSECTPCKQAR